jgi:hypothetical protein
MSQTYDDYIAKMAELEEATKTVTGIIARLRSFAAPLLDNWRRCYLVPPTGSVPMGMSNRPQRVDASNVPQPSEIHAAMVAHSNVLGAAQEAYRRLSQTERDQLIVPKWDQM